MNKSDLDRKNERVRGYRTDRMMLYGPCWVCGGPQTTCWNVEGTPPDLVISMGRMCLDCGEGDPSYRPDPDARRKPA